MSFIYICHFLQKVHSKWKLITCNTLSSLQFSFKLWEINHYECGLSEFFNNKFPLMKLSVTFRFLCASLLKILNYEYTLCTAPFIRLHNNKTKTENTLFRLVTCNIIYEWLILCVIIIEAHLNVYILNFSINYN